MSASSEGRLSQILRSNPKRTPAAIRVLSLFMWSLTLALYTVTIALSVRRSIPPCQCAIAIDGKVRVVQIVYSGEDECDPVRWEIWGGEGGQMKEMYELKKEEVLARNKKTQEAETALKKDGSLKRGKEDTGKQSKETGDKDRQKTTEEFALALNDIHAIENPNEARVAKKHEFFATHPAGGTANISLPADRTAYIKFFAGFGKTNENKDYREKDVRNGTFVEVGAFDGKRDSMSLFFEKNLGWSGILIEGATPNARLLRKTKRAAKTIKIEKAACRRPRKVKMIGDGPTATRDEFVPDKNRKQLEKGWAAEWRKPYDVECRQLSEMLKDTNTSKVDLMIIRAGVGEAADILRGLSLKSVDVRVLGVRLPETKFSGKGSGDDESQVRQYLLGNDFCLAVKVGELEFWTGDNALKKQYCGWSAFYSHP